MLVQHFEVSGHGLAGAHGQKLTDLTHINILS